MEKTTDKKTIGSVIKAMEIIELLASSNEEIGATEISQKLNYGVSATYHLLMTLKWCKVIEQNSRTKKYRLGMRLWKIGKIAREQNPLTLLIQPYLKKLRELTDETANLTVLDNGEIVYIAQDESTRLVRMFTKIGARIPLHCSAAGKVLLAYQSKENQDAVIARLSFEKFTDKTVTDPEKLKQELKRIGQNGYAFDNEERELGVSCIAAPIFDFNGEAIAAISISGPSERFSLSNRDHFIEHVLAVTEQVSVQFKNE